MSASEVHQQVLCPYRNYVKERSNSHESQYNFQNFRSSVSVVYRKCAIFRYDENTDVSVLIHLPGFLLQCRNEAWYQSRALVLAVD